MKSKYLLPVLLLIGFLTIGAAMAVRYYGRHIGLGTTPHFVGHAGGLTNILSPGSDQNVIFNDGGILGAEAGFSYNKTTDELSISGLSVTTLAISDLTTESLTISSNSWMNIPPLAEGDNVYASSNGTPYVIAKQAGVSTTNAVGGTTGLTNHQTGEVFFDGGSLTLTNGASGVSNRISSAGWSSQFGIATNGGLRVQGNSTITGNETITGNGSAANYTTTVAFNASGFNIGTIGYYLGGEMALSGNGGGAMHIGNDAHWTTGLHLGVDSSSPGAMLTIYGPDSTGTDNDGVNRNYDAPNGTGTGGSGYHIWRTAGPRETGSSVCVMSNQMTLSPTGSLWVANGMRTNSARFDVSTSEFVIGDRYTNSARRSFVTASFQLSAAAAGTAAVSLRCEQAGVTNRVNISAGPLASLSTVEQLSLMVGPGAFYYFVDDTSGTGASVSIVAGTSSRTDL